MSEPNSWAMKAIEREAELRATRRLLQGDPDTLGLMFFGLTLDQMYKVIEHYEKTTGNRAETIGASNE